jgi:hypothetical protein
MANLGGPKVYMDLTNFLQTLGAMSPGELIKSTSVWVS